MLANPQMLGQQLQQPIRQQIIIVRHGDTKFNSDGTGERVRGWSNVPLTAQGQKEAAQAAKKLRGKTIAGLVSSDLVRAQQTAEIVGKALGLKPEFDPRLRTWHVGMFSGGHSHEVQDKIDAYVDHPDQPIPGGESFHQFVTRAFSGAANAAQKYFGRTVLLVTHHSVERALEAWDSAGQPPNHQLDLDVYHEKGDKPGGIKTLISSVPALRGTGSA